MQGAVHKGAREGVRCHPPIAKPTESMMSSMAKMDCDTPGARMEVVAGRFVLQMTPWQLKVGKLYTLSACWARNTEEWGDMAGALGG